MDKFLTKWNGREIEDWGSVVSDEFREFARDFKSYVKRCFDGTGYKVEGYHAGHYDMSGFLVKEGDPTDCVYFSYNVPRYEKIDVTAPGAHYGVLYRTAENTKDFRGGMNHFSSLAEFNSERLLEIGKGDFTFYGR